MTLHVFLKYLQAHPERDRVGAGSSEHSLPGGGPVAPGGPSRPKHSPDHRTAAERELVAAPCRNVRIALFTQGSRDSRSRQKRCIVHARHRGIVPRHQPSRGRPPSGRAQGTARYAKKTGRPQLRVIPHGSPTRVLIAVRKTAEICRPIQARFPANQNNTPAQVGVWRSP